MSIIKEFREFFLRSVQTNSGSKPDIETGYATTYTIITDSGTPQTVYNRFLKDHFPSEGVFRKLFESITFKLNPEDTASVSLQGLIKLATDAQIQARAKAENSFSLGITPKNLPRVTGNLVSSSFVDESYLYTINRNNNYDISSFGVVGSNLVIELNNATTFSVPLSDIDVLGDVVNSISYNAGTGQLSIIMNGGAKNVSTTLTDLGDTITGINLTGAYVLEITTDAPATHTVDLSSLLGDSVDSGSFDIGTGVLTLTRTLGSDITIDLSALDNPGDNITSLSINLSTSVLTIVTDLGNHTIDLTGWKQTIVDEATKSYDIYSSTPLVLTTNYQIALSVENIPIGVYVAWFECEIDDNQPSQRTSEHVTGIINVGGVDQAESERDLLIHPFVSYDTVHVASSSGGGTTKEIAVFTFGGTKETLEGEGYKLKHQFLCSTDKFEITGTPKNIIVKMKAYQPGRFSFFKGILHISKVSEINLTFDT